MQTNQTPEALAEECKRLRDEIERPQLQGGYDNDELREAWDKKLPGVIPTDREMTAFALGVEVGNVGSRMYFIERNSARDAWARRVKECEQLQAEVDRLRDMAASGAKDAERLRDALEELADLVDMTRAGNYQPDSFTTQPARAAIAATKRGGA